MLWGNAQINKHAPEIAKHYAEKILELLPPIWMHFQTRYVHDGNTTSIFDTFEFKPGDKKEKVTAALLANITSSNRDKVESLLRIAFRLRNNLYHGYKDVSKFYDQNENFKQINSLLMALMDARGII